MNKHYKLVIFDLDGTLTPPRELSAAPFEQRLLPGVKEKCRELWEQGVKLGIATNQSKVVDDSRKQFDLFMAHTDWLKAELGINHVRYATERWALKPQSTLLELVMNATREFSCGTLMVGDSIEDQKAAEAAGVDFEWAKDFFGWEQEEKQ